jgi:hypothetical protein
MKTLRNISLAVAAACSLTACVPPTVGLKVSTTAPDAPQGASVTINAGEAAVLNWTAVTNMPFKAGATQTVNRDYSITSSDALIAAVSIADPCKASSTSTDWTCVKASHGGVTTVTPFKSVTYTFTATEKLYSQLAGLPIPTGDPYVKAATVTVTVNQDVAISSLLPKVTDTNLRTCITDNATAQGATTTSQLVNLICSGKSIVRLTGLQYFYNVSILDLSSNALSSSEANGSLAPTYLTNATSVNLQNSGLVCAKQKEIKAALPAATVLVGQGASACP